MSSPAVKPVIRLKPKIKNDLSCHRCKREFTQRGSLNRHINGQACKALTDPNYLNEELGELQSPHQPKLESDITQVMFRNIKKGIREIRDAQKDLNLSQINSQGRCLTAHDNLIEILQDDAVGQFKLKQALNFVKECAVGDMIGNLRLIEKIYLNGSFPALMYTNHDKTQFVYYGDNNERIVESNIETIAKMLIDNIRKSYINLLLSLKGDGGKLINIGHDHHYLVKIEPKDFDVISSHIDKLDHPDYPMKLLNPPIVEEVSKLKFNQVRKI